MDGIAHVQAFGFLEEEQGPAEIRFCEVVKSTEKGDVGGFTNRLVPVAPAPPSHVDELLDQLDACLALEMSIRDQADQATTRIPVGMVIPDGIQEDGCVEEDAAQSRLRQGRPTVAPDNSSFRVSQSSTGIGSAARRRAPAAWRACLRTRRSIASGTTTSIGVPRRSATSERQT